jgi:hypothetical protein
MTFGFFNRKPIVEHYSICHPSNVKLAKSPFKELKQLTGSYEHENVSLAQCTYCGQLALYYSTDIYDDFWQYWCIIDDAAHAQLLEAADRHESQLAMHARSILERHPYLLRHPILGFEWVPAGHAVIEGPPW